jgi:hypothetical protein
MSDEGNYEWLDALLDATKESESPVRFKLWAALFCVSVAAKRRVWLNMKGLMKTYPNMYVMIIAESGLGKQFPITMATKLLRHSGVARVVSGRNSIEAIIESIGKSVTLESGNVIRFAEAGIISGEFANLLVDNTSALRILTELYDTDALDIWDNTLRKGQDRLRNVYLSMFAATNMEHFTGKVSESDIKGGFISRTICVHETEVGTLNSLMGDEEEEINFAKYAERLKEIAQFQGPMKMSEDAKATYDKWYYPFHSERYNDKTGFVNRVRTHILKVAMCLSLIERDDLLITEKHVTDSMGLVLPIIEDTLVISKQAGTSKYRSHYALIIQELIRAPYFMMTRKDLLNKHRGEFTARDLNEAIDTLVQGGSVDVIQMDEEVGYRLTADAQEDVKRKQKVKKKK